MSDTLTAEANGGPGRKTAARPLRLPSSSIFLRETRNALPAMASLAVLGVLVGLLPSISRAISSSQWSLRLEPQMFFYCFVAVGYMAALVLGVYCGAEEIENGTADFPRRLPISRARILAGKIAGSCAGFIAWGAMFLVLAFLLASCVDLGAATFLAEFLSRFAERVGESYRPSFTWQVAPCLYCFGLAAGAWSGRVVLSAVIAGIALLGYTMIALTILGGGQDLEFLLQWQRPVYWPAIVISLPVAVVGFWRREAR